ncbi:hypothetical protein OG21DRAFT_1516696 [Imleria badia]|nr:hypothetical protein OG21DRAFT_1516696 [Imleria badia]
METGVKVMWSVHGAIHVSGPLSLHHHTSRTRNTLHNPTHDLRNHLHRAWSPHIVR